MTNKPLDIGFPVQLGRVVGAGQPFSEPIAVRAEFEGMWVTLKGGELPRPVTVRVDETDDGRFIITGLLLGHGEREEITWATLRAIKPSTLLAYIFEGFDPLNPMKKRAAGEIDAASIFWQSNRPGGRPRPRDAPPAASGWAATDLQQFADVYARHRALTPHKAMKATSEELNISRATAIRRAAQCREVGLLPPKESK